MNYFASRSSSSVMEPPSRRWYSPPSAQPAPSDFTRFITEGMLQPVMEGMSTAAVNFRDSMGALGQRGQATPDTQWSRRPRHQKDCGCREDCDCGCEHEDPCHCRCCIVDADLVVYTRLGETRVIPFSIENKWRRERKVKLELSQFRRKGGAFAPVTAESASHSGV